MKTLADSQQKAKGTAVFHPETVLFMVRDGDRFTVTVESYLGRFDLPLHADQAQLLMAAANEAGQVADYQRMPGGRKLVAFCLNNRLLASANPTGYGREDELIALVRVAGRYVAWVSGEGAGLRLIADHEAHVILRRARSFQGKVVKTIVRQEPYLFACEPQDGIGNDLASTLTADAVPVEWAIVPNDVEVAAEFAELFGVDLESSLRNRLVGSWQMGAV